jgi:hypothetical protein
MAMLELFLWVDRKLWSEISDHFSSSDVTVESDSSTDVTV